MINFLHKLKVNSFGYFCSIKRRKMEADQLIIEQK